MTAEVTLVAGSFYPREGGAERQLRAVLGARALQGGRCSVVTQVIQGEPRRADVDGISVRRVGSIWLYRHVPPLGKVYFLLSALLTLVRVKPDRVVSLQFGSATMAARIFTRVRRVPHIVRLTGGGTSRHRSEPVALASRRSGRATVRFVLKGSDVTVVAPARHLLEDLRESFPQHSVRTELVPNGVTLPEGATAMAQQAKDGAVWYARSGTETSVEFFHEVARQCGDIQFTVIGQQIDSADSPNVESLGWVAEPVAVLAGARVLLNTSLTEGMPNTALQALSVGCHVVGAHNAGLAELKDAFPDAVTLYAHGDVEDACAKLRLAHSEPSQGALRVPSAEDAVLAWAALLQAPRP